jgi:hypothetical protein
MTGDMVLSVSVFRWQVRACQRTRSVLVNVLRACLTRDNAPRVTRTGVTSERKLLHPT